jgi:PrtD family type I secretion system ABC transporter
MEQGRTSPVQTRTTFARQSGAGWTFERLLGITGTAQSNPLRYAAEACVRPIAIIGLFTFFVNFLLFISPIYMMQVYDRVLTSRSIETLVFLTLIALFVLAMLAVFEHVRGQMLVNLGEWIDAYLSHSLFARMISASIGTDSYQGDRLRDLATLRTFLGSPALTAVLDAMWTPMFIAVAFLLHPLLGLVALASAIFLFVLAWIDEVTTRAPLQRAGIAAGASAAHAMASARNAELIESMGMLDVVGARWFAKNREALVQARDASMRSKKIVAVSRFFRLAVYIAVLGVGAWLAVNREITGGVMVAASIIVSRALAPIEQAITVWRQLVSVRFAIHRLNDNFTQEHRVETSLVLPTPAGRLSAENLTYLPPKAEKPILRNVSFVIAPGECVAVVGPSGSGKSTLARLLVGAYRPTAGHVRLDAADVQQWRRTDLGKHFGYVPQTVQLLPGTIRDNISRMRDANDFDDEQIIAAAKRAGVHDLILRLPKGYDTLIGDGGLMLSGGQRQRIALALALFGMPRVVVLDEPNSNLDAEGEAALLRALAMLREAGSTVVVITHKLNLIGISDKVLVMRDGAVEMFGPRVAVLDRLGGAVQTTAPAGADGQPVATGA